MKSERVLDDPYGSGEKVTAAEWIRRSRNKEHAERNNARKDATVDAFAVPAQKAKTIEQYKQEFADAKAARINADRAIARREAEIAASQPQEPLNAPGKTLELLDDYYLQQNPKIKRQLKQAEKVAAKKIAAEQAAIEERQRIDSDQRVILARQSAAGLLRLAELTEDESIISAARDYAAYAADGRDIPGCRVKDKAITEALHAKWLEQRAERYKAHRKTMSEFVQSDEQLAEIEKHAKEIESEPPAE